MQVRKNEVLFIYNSDHLQEREALAYVRSIKSLMVKELDVAKDNLTELQLVQLAQRLDLDPSDWIDQKTSANSLSNEDIYKMLANNGRLIRTPIAVYHHSAELVTTPYRFVRKDLEVTGIRSDKANPDEKGV